MLTAAPEADEHLHDARDLVLRAGRVSGAEAASHAENVESGGALHRRTLRDREEVMAVPARPPGAALGERERDRRGSAFDLVAKCRTRGFREGGNHRGEFDGDAEAIEALMVEDRRLIRGGWGGLVGCFIGREIQGGTP